MSKNNNILERAKTFGYPPLDMTEIKFVEEQLNIEFGSLFKEISSVSNYEYYLACGLEFFNFGRIDICSVINETLEYRRILNLPEKFIIISNIDSIIFTLLENNKENSVLSCSLEEFDYICENGHYPSSVTVYPTFMDFFEYLLEQEELERNNST